MSRVIAIVNQKGGVGKSTTAVNLGACLAAAGCRTLIIDLDPQANATSGLGVSRERPGATAFELLVDAARLDQCAVTTEIPGLDLIPGTIDLAGMEIQLADTPDRERLLRQKTGSSDYQIVLLDCPPSLGLLTVNALTSASEALIPLQCEYYALEGLTQLLRSIELVRRHLNPGLGVIRVLLTMYDARTRLSEQVAAEVRKFFGDQMYSTIIPRSVRIAEAPSHGKPITLYDPGSRGAQAYGALAMEVISRGRHESPVG